MPIYNLYEGEGIVVNIEYLKTEGYTLWIRFPGITGRKK